MVKNKRNRTLELSRIEQLPDDILLLILSLLPTLAETARTSILSRRWRNVWHNITILDFDSSTLLSYDFNHTHAHWYKNWVNTVIRARATIPGLPLVKELRIRYKLDLLHSSCIGRWINFAISNQVETLHLELGTFRSCIPQNKRYTLCEELWYKSPSGLLSLQYLKSLCLRSVNVRKQFIVFILSNCPILEDLSLEYFETPDNLNVSRTPLLRLRRLQVYAVTKLYLNEVCAPHLTSLRYKSRIFNPRNIDVPKLNDLAIGSYAPLQPMTKYLKPFWNYFPQLEKLELITDKIGEFTLIPIPELVKLTYIKISVIDDTNLARYLIMNFIKSCPSLETFAFQMRFGKRIDRHNQQLGGKQESGYCFNSLKVIELYGNDDTPINQDIVKLIIKKSPNLEKLIVYVRCPFMYASDLRPINPEIIAAVKAKANKLCKRRPGIKITIV